MKRLWNSIKDALGIDTRPRLSSEALQEMFKTRYRAFRELLTANSAALEAMAEMEVAVAEEKTYSISFIRSKCTVIIVNLYKMIRNLLLMSDGRYVNLEPAFHRIEEQIIDIIEKKISGNDAGEWLLPINQVNRGIAAQCGEKMANIGEVATLPGVTIPPGFVITASASRAFYLNNDLYNAINRFHHLIDINDIEDISKKSEAIGKLIIDSPLPPSLEQQIYANYDRLTELAGRDILLAVRSSALGEDLEQASFAGLYDSVLNVKRDGLIKAYKEVLASKYSAAAISYRLNKGYMHEDSTMCVGCMIMIEAMVSGVCYSRALSGNDQEMDIFFSQGSAEGIVDGTKNAGHAVMNRAAPFHLVAMKRAEDGGEGFSEAKALELAMVAMRLEEHFGAPQDIEWCLDAANCLYILQSRPISALLFRDRQEEEETVIDDGRLLMRGGVTGCGGAGCGPVRVVRNHADMMAFQKGEVLLVEHPLPEWAPLIQQAAALVAESGSEAGHLATISREFALPSLFALEQATHTLDDGDDITVDASNRAIYRGRVEELLQEVRKQPNLMSGSPVEKTMTEVLKLITPLNLTDPASPYFRGAYCKTMHDITRFCHEKSVTEMFSFGQRYQFADGASKQMITEDAKPLDWHVINLADGFSDDFDTKSNFIRISQITSQPMQAIWEGMHAYPWEGPPAGGVRGMGNIIFQSAMNPTLDPAISSGLTKKNYFLISRNYCNLSVRLGYHYAMVEAFISSLRTERYVTFRFRGGAADETNRVGRIELISQVLEYFQFRVEKTGDALAARVEKREQKFIADRLRVLGYLCIHTRQIDMVIDNPQHFQRYRNKFQTEIEAMIGNDQ
ncbi:MAG: pyruvate, water dikinase [Desulfobulbaceae bacterium]|jgi:pyruvate,water dikinase|nr:pyruvate, water dikinase [Desulfobulbaceae bacterium]